MNTRQKITPDQQKKIDSFLRRIRYKNPTCVKVKADSETITALALELSIAAKSVGGVVIMNGFDFELMSWVYYQNYFLPERGRQPNWILLELVRWVPGQGTNNKTPKLNINDNTRPGTR